LFGELRALAADLIQLIFLQLEIVCHQAPVRSRPSWTQPYSQIFGSIANNNKFVDHR
jgi:hypothetical protein